LGKAAAGHPFYCVVTVIMMSAIMLNVVAPAIGTKNLAKIGGKWVEQKIVTVIINFMKRAFPEWRSIISPSLKTEAEMLPFFNDFYPSRCLARSSGTFIVMPPALDLYHIAF
jgi:hypothetical protein